MRINKKIQMDIEESGGKMKDISQYMLGRFSTCSICKKKFLPAPMHMYKTERETQCSYTCYRKAGGDNGKQRWYARSEQK